MSYLIGAFVAFLFIVLSSWLLSAGKPLDDTDNKLTGDRSNLRILIDHGTGCQYLTTSGGGVTPRLDANGVPICKKEPA